jgi:hypothetical protein
MNHVAGFNFLYIFIRILIRALKMCLDIYIGCSANSVPPAVQHGHSSDLSDVPIQYLCVKYVIHLAFPIPYTS